MKSSIKEFNKNVWVAIETLPEIDDDIADMIIPYYNAMIDAFNYHKRAKYLEAMKHLGKAMDVLRGN